MIVNLILKPWLSQLRLDSIVVTFWGIFPAPSDTSFSVNLSLNTEGAGAWQPFCAARLPVYNSLPPTPAPPVSADPTVDP